MRTRETGRRLRGVPLAWAVTLALLAGCGGEDGDDDDEEGQMGLEDRPRMEQIVADYRTVGREIVQALTDEFGEVGWRPSDARGDSRSGCPGAPQADAEKVRLQPYIRDGAYDDDQLSEVIAVIDRVAGEHGFSPLERAIETDEYVQFNASDQWGGLLEFGIDVHAGISLTTDCHLWETVPERGQDW